MSECDATVCGCGNVQFQGLSPDYKARLWTVIALNASMFVVEMGAVLRPARKPCKQTRLISSATP
jgi:hypothetical protein